MTSKIVEALAKILEGLNIDKISLEEVNNYLNKYGEFDKQTVSAAFSLVYDKVLSSKVGNNKQIKVRSKNFRFLTEDEKEILGLNNYNYLMYLLNVGLITVNDVEMILEQIMMFPDDTITKEDINWIIFISLVEFNADILPGSRVLLYSSDTIN